MTATVAVVPATRRASLRVAGWALVVNEPLASVDIIVVGASAAGAGVLEAADLVKSGIATRVAVFADPPDAIVDSEFIRRGVPYEDAAARAVRQLRSLGVSDIAVIPRFEAGTENEAKVLPSWCDENELTSLVFVSLPDHTRRLRRAIRREMKAHDTRVIIRSTRYSSFDPDRWWDTRDGIRTEVIEFQKLLLELVRHPIPG